MIKRVLKSEAVSGIFILLLALYLRLVFWSSRYEFVGKDNLDRFWAEDGAFIIAFWHNRLAMMSFVNYRPVEIRVLISAHRDGRLMSGVVKHLGIKTIAGSTDQRRDGRDRGKGGTSALREMVRSVKSGITVGISPDGPRGPRMRASEGVVVLAKLSGAAVVPVSVATSRQRILKSWDRFLFPLPFARGVFVSGAPIYVPRDGDGDAMEHARQRIERALNEVSDEADRLVGQPPIEPALLPQSDGKTVRKAS